MLQLAGRQKRSSSIKRKSQNIYKGQPPELLSGRVGRKFYRKLTHKSRKIQTEPIIIRPSEILVTKIRSYFPVISNCQNRNLNPLYHPEISRNFTNHQTAINLNRGIDTSHEKSYTLNKPIAQTTISLKHSVAAFNVSAQVGHVRRMKKRDILTKFQIEYLEIKDNF